MREYLRVAFNRVPIAKQRRHPVSRAVHKMISLPARWRLDHHYYKYPVELWLKDTANRLLQPPEARVDPHPLAEPATC